MRPARKIIWLVLLAAAAAAAGEARAQDGQGGTRSVFNIGAGARGIAMGGAFTAACDDASALYYNPAALRNNRHWSVTANHIQLFSGFSDAGYDFIGMVYPTMSVGAVGIGFMTAGTGEIRGFDEQSRETGELTYRESQAILAYAFDLPWRWLGTASVGSSVKFLNQRVGDFSDNGTGIDAGLVFRPGRLDGLSLGCNFQDVVGAETKLVETTERVDRTIMIGLGYRHPFGDGSSIMASVQMDMPERADADARFGAEYRYRDLFAVRVGFDSEQITAGVGFGWRGILADYGFFSREEAGSSHPISLSYRIGPSLGEREREREERARAEQEQRFRRYFNDRVSEHMDAALRLQAGGDLERALDEYKIVLEYDPGNAAASDSLASVQAEILRRAESRMRSRETAVLVNQHFELGLRYYSNNEYILARAEWRNVLELDPENREAREYLERTVEKLDEQIAVHSERARRLEREGRFADALGEWNIVRLIDPNHMEATESAARISRRMEQINRSYRQTTDRLRDIELFDEAVRLFSEGRYEETRDRLGDLLRHKPDHEEARKLMRRVERRLEPLSDEEKELIRRLYIEGMKHFTQNDYNAAIAEWRKILEIDPDNESVQKNIEEAETRLRRME